MNLFDFLDASLTWLAVVAVVGMVAMLLLVLLVIGMKWGVTADFVRRTVFRAPTLRGRLLVGLFLIGAIPVMTLPPILTLENARVRQLELVDELRADASDLAHSITRMVAKQIAGIDALAAHINSLDEIDPSGLGDWLLRHHNAHPEFVSTWIARPDGRIVAATAFLEGDQRPWAGPRAGVSLMDYFEAALASGGLYVSPVMKGVPPRHDPMIVISAPIFAESSRPWGFIQAQLNLRRVYRNVASYDLIPGRPVFLTDSGYRVMVASPQIRFETFENLSGHSVVTRMSDGNNATYEFKGEVEIDQPASPYLAVQRTLESGWHVFAVASLAGMQNQALIFVALSLFWVLIVSVLAVNLASLYGGIVDDPLQTLHQSLDVFDAEQTMKMVPMVPENAPREIVQVFERVRRSMEKSRDSYRNMLRAVNEGEELRRKLKVGARHRETPPQGKGRPKPDPAAATAAASKKQPAQGKAAREYSGRWDSLTELAGREVFKEFFGEAWVLGCTDTRPLSLLLLSIGFGQARAKIEGGPVEDSVFKSTGETLRGIVGRELDLVARIDADKFAVVLPDTDLYGALVVAERARQAVQGTLPEISGGKALAANVGAASIAPIPTGDASSFIKVAQRVLIVAEKKEGSRLAYVNEEHKIKVLEIGEPLPTATAVSPEPDSGEVAEVPARQASSTEDESASASTSDLILSLEETRKVPSVEPAAASEPKDGKESSAAEPMNVSESSASDFELSLEQTLKFTSAS